MARLNWKLATVPTILGAGAIAFGLYLLDFSKDSWSSALINIGTTLALVATLVVLERRLVAEVKSTAATTARTVAREETGALEQRLIRLEDLDNVQLTERQERRNRERSTAEAVRTGALDSRSIGTLLREAAHDGIFAEEGIRARTSDDPDCPLLHVLVLAFNDRDWLFLDFQPIRYSGRTMEDVPVPDHSPTMVLWTEDNSIAEIAGQLEAALERSNAAVDKFRLSYAIDRLTRSVEIMREARAAPSGSGLRLEGKLRLLINDDWVLTDWGLESVLSTERYPVEYSTLIPGVAEAARIEARRIVNRVLVPESTIKDASPSLSEALTWIRDRERLNLSDPNEKRRRPPPILPH